jgi:hypothetical protein
MEVVTGWPGSHDNPSRGSVAIEFCSHRARAKGTQVFVFVAFGQNQQQPFSHRNGAAAGRAVKLGGIELFKGCGRAVGTVSATGSCESDLRLHRSGNLGFWLLCLNAFFFVHDMRGFNQYFKTLNNIFNPPICQQVKDTGTAQMDRFIGSPSNRCGGCGDAAQQSSGVKSPFQQRTNKC